MIRIFFDLETGGVEAHHPNIQLAAVAVDDNWKELDTFERKIAFDRLKASEDALAMNHWTAEAWAKAIPQSQAIEEFSRWSRPYQSIERMSRSQRPYRVGQLAGHNVATFDGPRLHRAYQEAAEFMPFDYRVLCTMQLALWLKPGRTSYKLHDLCADLGLVVDKAHDALSDVRSSIALARHLLTATDHDLSMNWPEQKEPDRGDN